MERLLDMEDLSPQRDRWLLSYADLLTLLLAFFVVMYSVSVVNEKKLHEIASSIEIEMIGAVSNEPVDAQEKTAPFEIDIPNVEFKEQDKDWIEFTLESEFLFASGDAELRPDISSTLNNLLLVLSSTQGDIRVEGHTDDIPISTRRFPSNWELSAARAAAVVRFFELGGIDANRLSATGLSSSIPIGDNATAAGRKKNRRVILKIRAFEGDLEGISTLKFETLNSKGADNLKESKVIGIEQKNAEPKNNNSDEIGLEGSDLEGFDLEGIDPELLMQILNELDSEANQASPDNG